MNRFFARLSLFALGLVLLVQPLYAARIDSAAPGFTGSDYREPYRLETASERIILRAAFSRSAAGMDGTAGTLYAGAFRGVDAVRSEDGVAREALTIRDAGALVAFDLVEAKGMIAAVADRGGVRFLARHPADELAFSAPLLIDAEGRPSLGARWVVDSQDGRTQLRLQIDDASLRYPIEVHYAQGRSGLVAAASSAALRAAASRTLLPKTDADGVLSGRVTDSVTGSGIPDAFVNVYYSTGDYATTAFTDTTGNYSISLPPDTYYVTGWADGYQTKLYNNISCASGCVITNGNAVVVTSGGTTPNINFSLVSARATISGVVTNIAGAPLEGVYVVIYTSTGSAQAVGVTDAAGAYTANVTGGTYRARTFNFTYAGLVDQLYSGIDCTECNVTTGTAINAPNGSTVTGINFALRTGASISGTVTDASTAAAVPFGVVTIYNASNVAVTSISVDEAGSYSTYFGLAAGTYYAVASSSGYTSELYNNLPCASCTPSSGTAITLTQGQQRTGVNFTLALSIARITGHVRNGSTNAPLGGVLVYVYNGSTAVAAVQSSYVDGSYEVVLSGGGTFYLRTQNDVYPGLVDQLYNGNDCTGCDPTTGTPVTVSAGSTAANIDFALNATAGAITGHISDSVSTDPLAGAYVQIYNAAGQQVTFGSADGSGNFTSFHGLAAGTYYALASANGFQPELYNEVSCSTGCDPTTGTAIVVAAGATVANVNFTLSSAFGRIAGTVTVASSGSPLSDVNILVYDGNDELVSTAVTDGSGNYVAFVPVSGTYYVRTLADAYPQYVDELFDDIPCTSCTPSTGTGVTATVGSLTPNINFSLGTAACAGFSIQPPTLADANLNQAYSQTLTAANATPPVTFSKLSGSLPPGVTLSSAGVISGTPTAVGVFTFVVSASDSGSCTTTREYQLEVVSGATTTTLTANPTSGTYPLSITFTATVDPSNATGTVAFFEGATNLGTATLSGGVATRVISTLGAGTHEIVATYGGDATHSGSTSSAVEVTIAKATPVFSNLSAPTIVLHTASTTISGTLSAGTAIPPGSVSITLNGVTQTATIQADGSFSSTFNTSALAIGSYTISFSYAGSANFNAATGSSTLRVIYNMTGGVLPSGSGQTGSTVPIRVQIFDANNVNLSDPNITVTAYGIRLVSSSTWLPAQTTGSSNDMEFDFQNAGGGSYKFNLKLTGVAPGSYVLGVTVQGEPAGVIHELPFTVTP